MTAKHIDHADELDRYARESEDFHGCHLFTHDGVTLEAAAKELRELRAELAEAAKLVREAAEAYDEWEQCDVLACLRGCVEWAKKHPEPTE